MATTPEGRVKAAVKKVLSRYPVHGCWPVPYGYGASQLDYVGCANGFYFTIETKAPGKKPTDRQMREIALTERAGGKAFVIDAVDDPRLDTLDLWLKTTCGAPA